MPLIPSKKDLRSHGPRIERLALLLLLIFLLLIVGSDRFQRRLPEEPSDAFVAIAPTLMRHAEVHPCLFEGHTARLHVPQFNATVNLMTKPEARTLVENTLSDIKGVDSASLTMFIKGATKPENFSCAGSIDATGRITVHVHPPEAKESEAPALADNPGSPSS